MRKPSNIQLISIPPPPPLWKNSSSNQRLWIFHDKMWWKDLDFAFKTTGKSGFFNFADNFPLCCLYGRVSQQLEGLNSSKFLSLPQDCISAAACPWILGDFCMPTDFLFHRGNMDINWNHPNHPMHQFCLFYVLLCCCQIGKFAECAGDLSCVQIACAAVFVSLNNSSIVSFCCFTKISRLEPRLKFKVRGRFLGRAWQTFESGLLLI